MSEKGIDKSANAQTTMCTQTTTRWRWHFQEGENTNVLLQERSLDYFCMTIKEQDKFDKK